MYKWIILALVFLGTSVWGLVYSSIGPLAPFFIRDLHFTSTQVGLLVSAVATGYSIMMIPAGIWADLTGVRILLSVGVLFLGILSFAVTQYASFIILFILFIFIGMAGGSTLPTSSKAVMDWFPREGRATAMGIKQSGVNMGGMVAGILLPFLAVRFNWQFSLKMIALLNILSAIIIFVLYKESLSGTRRQVGSRAILIKDSIKLISDGQFLLMSVTNFLMLVVQFGFTTYLVLFLTRKQNFEYVLAGEYLFASFAAGMLGRVGFGLLSDFRFKEMRSAILLFMAAVMTLVCLLLGAFAEYPLDHWVIFILVSAFGLTGIGAYGIFLTIVVELTKAELAGLAAGFSSTIGFIGVIIGTPIFGYILDRTASFSLAWHYLMICSLASVICIVFFRRKEGIKRSRV